MPPPRDGQFARGQAKVHSRAVSSRAHFLLLHVVRLELKLLLCQLAVGMHGAVLVRSHHPSNARHQRIRVVQHSPRLLASVRLHRDHCIYPQRRQPLPVHLDGAALWQGRVRGGHG